MRVKIYQPAANPTQSGATPHHWLIEYEPTGAKKIDPLMGWTGSSGTLGQLRLQFDTKEAAIAYADRHGLNYTVIERTGRVRKPNIRPGGYGENFAAGRRTPWTH